MTQETQTAGPLKRVTVAFKARDGAAARGPFSFIFGIGKNGLTPFERLLEGKPVGASVEMTLDGKTLFQWFDYLTPTLPDLGDLTRPAALDVTVENITVAGGREVIEAMAAMVEGCACGCGCGGHGAEPTGCAAGDCSTGACGQDRS